MGGIEIQGINCLFRDKINTDFRCFYPHFVPVRLYRFRRSKLVGMAGEPEVTIKLPFQSDWFYVQSDPTRCVGLKWPALSVRFRAESPIQFSAKAAPWVKTGIIFLFALKGQFIFGLTRRCKKFITNFPARQQAGKLGFNGRRRKRFIQVYPTQNDRCMSRKMENLFQGING
jgi:hypothetical protein